MNPVKRLDYLDMAKGIGIFFVALGHLEYVSTESRLWLSSFVMPLFFIISGILMAYSDEPKREWNVIIKKRTRSLIIPYLWFSLSYFIIDIGNLNVVKNIDLHTFIVDTIESATFYGMSVLWFLPGLFLSALIFLFFKKKFSDKITIPAMFAVAVVSYVIKLQFEKIYAAHESSLLITSLIHVLYVFLRAAVAQSLLGCGYYAKKFFDMISKESPVAKIASSRPLSLIIGFILLGVNFLLANQNGCIDIRNILLNNVLLFYIAAFAGCMAIIMICRALPPSRLIMYFGRNSLIVMACHINYYILYAGIKVAWFVDAYNKRAKHYVFVAVTMIVVFILSAVVIEVINRFFPFVLGKKRVKVSGNENVG